MNKITLTKVNNEVIVPYKIERPKDDEILGYDTIPYLYVNCFVTAPTFAGKSTIVSHMIRKCADKDTIVIIFAASFYSDLEWEQNRKYMKKHKIPFTAYTEIKEGKVNHLHNLINQLKAEDFERHQKEEEEKELLLEQKKNGGKKHTQKTKPRPLFITAESESDSEVEDPATAYENEKRKKKKKLKSCDYLIIFDDMSLEIRNDPQLQFFLKMARQFRAKVVISSQDYHDIKPDARKQIRYWLFLKGVPLEKLEMFYKEKGLNCGLNNLYKMYKNATSKPFGFLTIDVPRQIFKSRFDSVYTVPKEDDTKSLKKKKSTSKK
jgi:hypothetical protein